MNNPYQPHSASSHQPIHVGSDLPTYSLVVFIVDLLFSLMRALLFAISLFAITQGFLPQEMLLFGILESIASFFMFAFGIPGNLLCLMRKSIGPKLIGGAIVATALSLLIAITQVAVLAPWNAGGPELVGFILGSGFTILIRIGILAAIVIAINMAKQADSFGPPKDEMTLTM